MNLDRLLAARSVAVVGASPSNGVARNLLAWGGVLASDVEYWPVNPRYDQVGGYRAYPSLQELPRRPDAIALAVGPARLGPLLDEAIALDPAGLAIYSDLRQVPDADRLRDEMRSRGIAVVGSNCMGALSISRGLSLYAGDLATRLLDPGPVGFISHSGSVQIGMISAAPRLRFSSLFSVGNEDTTTAADYIDSFGRDDATEVIGCFLEAIRDPEGFRRAARSAGKPIVVFTVGKSSQARQNVATHSGALAPDAAVMSAFLADCGVIEVSSVEALIETLVAFGSRRRPRGDGVGMIHVSGGQASLQLDVGQRHGVRFPGLQSSSLDRLATDAPWLVEPDNPIDAWGARSYRDTYPPALAVLADDPGIDIIVANQDMAQYVCDAGSHVTQAIAADLIASAATHDKPVFLLSNVALGFDEASTRDLVEAGIPVLVGAEAAYEAVGRWVRYWTRSPAGGSEIAARAVELPAPGALDEVRSLELLGRFGLRVPRMIEAADTEGAVAAATEIGFPVVVKGIGPLHKTDSGAVVTGIGSEPEARDAAVRILDGESVTGLAVAEQIERRRELMLGAHRDPQLGIVILVGVGGVMAEIIDDVQLAVPPVSASRAAEMVDGLRGASWLGPWRNLEAADRGALIDTIVGFGRAVAAMGDRVESIDVNPLAVLEGRGGCVMLDAVVVLR